MGTLLSGDFLSRYGSFVEQNNFDSLAVAASFLKFADQNSGMNFGAAWDAWVPDHGDILARYKGTNCVGLALGSLPLFEQYGGTLMKSTKRDAGHMAIRVPFKNPGTRTKSLSPTCCKLVLTHL